MRRRLRRVAAFFRKRQLDAELDAELATHVELATDEYVREGMPLEDARRMALVRLGGMEQSKETHRDARGLPTLDSIVQDVAFSLRMLRRESGFAAFTILIIGLGIGASATVFSVLNSLLVKPLPLRDPGSLVWFANRTKADGDMSGQTFQVNRLVAFKERNHSFSDVAGYYAFYGVGDIRLTGSGAPERLSAIPVSGNFFPLLGVNPRIGRQFTPEECTDDGPNAIMLSHGFWKRRFASDPKLIGKTVTVNDQRATVIGILPETFDFGAIFAPGAHPDIFYPFPLSQQSDRHGNTMALVGRLKGGVSLPAAQAEADILGDQISNEHVHQNYLHPKLTFLHEHVTGKVRPALMILACAVGVVMLIVCANLSNLMLARTAARQKEMAIRAALGAGRARLIRQLLTEGLLLTGCGALLGLALAYAATSGIAHLTAFSLPLLSSVQMDGRVLLFAVLVTTVTGMVLGISPALQLSSLKLNGSLGQRGASAGREHEGLRGVLVVSEIAFACVLLVGAGLFMRSLLQVLDVQLGFHPENAVAIRIDPSSQYKTQAQRNEYLAEALRRVRNIPGVSAAGVTDALPLGKNRTWGTGAKGKTYTEETYPSAFIHVVTDGYIRAMGMSVVKGRDLTEADTEGTTPVILINETMARTVWPGEDPLGKQIVRACGRDSEVVGVVDDVRHMALEKESGSEMYLDMRQCTDNGAWDLVVRSAMPLAAAGASLEAALRPIAPDLPKGGIQPLTQLVDKAVSPRRFIVLLLTGFAGFALVLASLGIFGLISYSVSQRTQEIGIRMAMGASAGNVQSAIVLRTIGLAAVGMMAGVAASLALARWVHGLLFGITAGDPLTFVGAAFLLMAIAVLAGYIPARGGLPESIL